ncbi:MULTISPECIES: carbohydrate ABC transporter permease [Shouchella]|uniref:Carbohydrate ABC transporter permease n=2 Tax=Shouchella TaxID=2893057 RepID=A0ABY7W879_9BACI|nr:MULTISPECIES: carbohydrate ABC transporter permease [Shouchella]MED4128669.1 carbohydrate ABC transporter permease [Shouchella miscanthi]WDF04821.1 carbohydrate ABC transporter permease [Shouchella hunanensis]GAF23847.1 maltose/maltodextrin ABC transporter, permease protein MalG [Bacillus sp. JCM 19047]
MAEKQQRSKIEIGFVSILLIIIGFILSIPFLWMLLSAFKPNPELIQIPVRIFPETWTLENFTRLFTEMNFGTYLRNTLILVGCALIGLIFNAMAGYSFAKFDFKGNRPLFFLVLATMMIPGQVTMIPVYLILNEMGLTNTMPGIVLPGLVAAFSIFLFKQFMTTIPDALIEAARLDGAGEFYIFFKLVLPMAKSILAVQGILAFIGAWNSFLWPLIVANSQDLYTLSVGLALLQGQAGENYALQMAGSAVMVVPILIIFAIFQKYIVDGFTMSGIK